MTATPWYQVDVTIQDTFSNVLSWSLVHNEGVVTDDIRVLDNLAFGWSMPTSPLWPLPPNPMTARAAITVPEFVDVEWVGNGVSVAFEVTVDATAGIAFAFYGRVTDAQATARAGRTGVTLSLNAVDYTIDPREQWPTDQGDPYAYDSYLLAQLWAGSNIGGAFPAWPTTPQYVAMHDTGTINPRDFIDQVLLTTVDALTLPPELLLSGETSGATDLARLFLAPVIDPTTGAPPLLGAAKHWAFDILWMHPRTPGITIDGSKLDRGSMTWARNKRTPPNVVTVNGPGPISYTASHAGGGRPYGPNIVETIDTVSADAPRVGGIATFYLPDTTPVRRGWNLTAVRWLLSREDPADLAALPLDLMPRWTAPEGDYDRASCYGRLITLDNVADDLNPWAGSADESLVGLLSACTLTVAGGHFALDLGFRQLQES